MLQPFEQFKDIYIERLIKLKKVYLVSQTYKRVVEHFDENERINILLTDYDSYQYAQVHFNAVKGDRYSSIINLEKPEHKAKLEEMLNGQKYQLYWSVVKSAENLAKRLDDKYTDHIKRYIQKNTTWRIARDSKITPKFEVVFGELFITIRYNTQQLRVKFEDIENV